VKPKAKHVEARNWSDHPDSDHKNIVQVIQAKMGRCKVEGAPNFKVKFINYHTFVD
jgi:hypothetical protein